MVNLSIDLNRREQALNLYNSLDVVITAISSTITLVNTPDLTGNFKLINKSDNTIFIGNSSVTELTGYPLSPNEYLELMNFYKSNSNEIYAISTTIVNLHCIGSVKQ